MYFHYFCRTYYTKLSDSLAKLFFVYLYDENTCYVCHCVCSAEAGIADSRSPMVVGAAEGCHGFRGFFDEVMNMVLYFYVIYNSLQRYLRSIVLTTRISQQCVEKL